MQTATISCEKMVLAAKGAHFRKEGEGMIIAEYIDPKTRQIKQLKFNSEQNYLSWLLESSVRIILKVGKAEKPQLAHRG